MKYIKPHLLTPQQEEELIGLYPDTDNAVLAKKYGVQKYHVIKIANLAGIYKRPNCKRKVEVTPSMISKQHSKYDVEITSIEVQMLVVSPLSALFDELTLKRNNLLARSFSFAK